ncbi:hypothetical protein QBC46DRAFT_393763 [Diplogelasinospora grovesii]|uniref:BTB domain-containing protein n=1 Tax=Diplogelasinospora grovesii TaxID=303347 RepID=A0AAN6S0S6_9PEZI|nr:hypothetical protein QBC46DRAFT_393763 [Diplogelasinospora grovesii]
MDSPYTSGTINLRTIKLPLRFTGEHGPICTAKDFAIHRAILSQYPKLASSLENDALRLGLPISNKVAHVLVHYLYTSTYDDAVEGVVQDDVSRFRTSLRVYAAAREYEVDGLAELAKEKIGHLGNGIDIFTMLDIVKGTYPAPDADDTWFSAYVTSQIKAAFEQAPALHKVDITATFGDGVSIAKTLVKNLIDIYYEKMASLQDSRASGDANRVLLTPLTVPSADDGLPSGAPTFSDLAYATEPEPEKMSEDDFWGLGTKKGKKREKDVMFEEPKWFPPPAAEPVPMPDEDVSAVPGKKSKKGKKGKKAQKSCESYVAPPTELEPKPEPEPVRDLTPDAEPLPEAVECWGASSPEPGKTMDDAWDSCKSSPNNTFWTKPEPEPEPVVEPKVDPWVFWGVGTDKRKMGYST